MNLISAVTKASVLSCRLCAQGGLKTFFGYPLSVFKICNLFTISFKPSNYLIMKTPSIFVKATLLTVLVLSWLVSTAQNNDQQAVEFSGYKIVFGLGFEGQGGSSQGPALPSTYFYQNGFLPFVGYRINEKASIGIIANYRMQRSSFNENENINGRGGGYFFRYELSQFPLIRNNWMRSHFVFDLDHQFCNYRTLTPDELTSSNNSFAIVGTSSYNNHHVMPKIGLQADTKHGISGGVLFGSRFVNFKPPGRPLLFFRLYVQYNL
jgi:hypothetical protein